MTIIVYADRISAPLCYNGDILFPADCRAVADRFPKVQAVMLGRGLIRDPALIGLMQGGSMPEKAMLRSFHDELFAAYRDKKWSENAILCHMKELWAFMGSLFDGSEKQEKAIRKAKRLTEYSDAVSNIFALNLREE